MRRTGRLASRLPSRRAPHARDEQLGRMEQKGNGNGNGDPQFTTRGVGEQLDETVAAAGGPIPGPAEGQGGAPEKISPRRPGRAGRASPRGGAPTRPAARPERARRRRTRASCGIRASARSGRWVRPAGCARESAGSRRGSPVLLRVAAGAARAEAPRRSGARRTAEGRESSGRAGLSDALHRRVGEKLGPALFHLVGRAAVDDAPLLHQDDRVEPCQQVQAMDR